MDQEKKKEKAPSAARNFEETANLLKTIIQSVSDLIPLFIEKWSMLKEKPAWKDIIEDNRRIKRKIQQIIKKQKLYNMFFFVLLLWNVILTLILVIKTH